MPENLENFSQFFFFNSKFGLSIKSWKLVPPYPPPDMGILDFSKFELSIKKLEIGFHQPPPPRMEIANVQMEIANVSYFWGDW